MNEFTAGLLARRDAAHAYLQALARPRWSTWTEGKTMLDEGALTVPEAMALIHPAMWDVVGQRQFVQGDRRFKMGPHQRQGACQAIRVWGYACDLPRDENLQLDHGFPYSLGGPTDPANCLILCALHNAMKGSDVHQFPWELGAPAWLNAVVTRIEAVGPTSTR